MINEQAIFEAYVKSTKDIYYNKDKFKNGETNLCFITGLSGSGKSSMSNDMTKNTTAVEHVDMDDVVINYRHYSISDFKSISSMIYAFLTGQGSKYYIDPNNKIDPNDYDTHNKATSLAFIDFAIQFAKSHKNKKFIVEGVYIYRYCNPSKLKDCAVCIKGTSAATSLYRASKRDNRLKTNIKNFKNWTGGEAQLKKYRDYFNALMQNDSLIKEAVLSLSQNDKKFITLEYLASDRFLSEATANYTVLQQAQKDINCFIAEFTINYSNINPSGIAKIKALENRLHENSYIIDKIKEKLDHLSKPTLPIERRFTNGKQYTELAPKVYYAALPQMKQIYLMMIDLLQRSTHVKDKIYVPGWDKISREDEPSKFFDKNSKMVYSSTYNGRKYGQLSITLCEIDGVWRYKLPKYIMNICNDIIPEEYNMDYINPNQVGFYVTSIEKDEETIAMVLSTNYFIWR